MNWWEGIKVYVGLVRTPMKLLIEPPKVARQRVWGAPFTDSGQRVDLPWSNVFCGNGSGALL